MASYKVCIEYSGEIYYLVEAKNPTEAVATAKEDFEEFTSTLGIDNYNIKNVEASQ